MTMLKLAPRFALRTVHAALAMMIALPLACGAADPKPAGSSSFKSGFSSQRSSSSSSSSKGGFGSVGKRASSSSSSSSSSSQAAEPAKARNGGFGSFGRAARADARQSDSALSRKLERDAAEARALRTLDERRAAQAARNAPPPPPRYDDGPRDQRYGQPYGRRDDGRGYGQAQPPVIVRQDSGLGQVIAGAVIANAAANAHARRNEGQVNPGNQQVPAQPAPSWNGGVDNVNGGVPGSVAAQPAPAHARGSSVFGTLFTLAVLALVAWAAYKLIMRARRKRAADKPNYSFERN